MASAESTILNGSVPPAVAEALAPAAEASATTTTATTANGEVTLESLPTIACGRALSSASSDAVAPPPQPVTGHKRKEFSTNSRGGRGGMSAKRGRGGGFGGGGGYRQRADSEANELNEGGTAPSAPTADPSKMTPIQRQFLQFASYLDARNDRRELIYQASRDLTRSSKKLISQLQRCTYAHSKPSERQSIIDAGKMTLSELHHLLASTIDEQFTASDYYRFHGSYSPGVQEFIESASLLHYLETGELITHEKIEADIEATLNKKIHIPISDYIVGILDLGSVANKRAKI